MLFELKNVIQKYSNKSVLDIDNLKIDRNSITAITGSNGSGKTTLLRLLALLESPFSGEVLITEDIKKIDITMIFAEPYLLRRSVEENLLFGAKIRNLKLTQKELHNALDSVGLLPKKFLKRYSNELSSGEAQRVVLASRLIFKPKVIILDEPTKSLDVAGIGNFTHAILDIREQLKTKIIVCDHNLEWLSKLTNDFISLNSGKISKYGSQNIITSEWSKGDGYFFTYLGKRNTLKAKTIPDKFRYAYIPPENIKISHTKTEYANSLNGEITGVRFYQQKSELSVKVGSSIFTCYTEEDKIAQLLTSKKVILNFSDEDIKFT